MATDFIRVYTKSRDVMVPINYVAGVYGDQDVKTVHFLMDRYFGDIDLLTYVMRINYITPSGVLDVYYTDPKVYTMDDHPTDDRYLTFDWLLGRNCFTRDGKIRFSICFRTLGDGAKVVTEWNSKIAEFKVYPGIEADQSQFVSAGLYSNLLDQLQQEIDDRKDKLIDDSSNQALKTVVTQEGTTLANVREAGDVQISNAALSATRAKAYADQAADYLSTIKGLTALSTTKITEENGKLYCSYEV